MSAARDVRIAALAVAAVALAYLNSFAGVFQFDDFKVIVANPTVHSLGAWREDLGGGIRPLLKLTYALNWIAGSGEAGFHAFNLAIHVANTLLVFWLARQLAAGHGLEDSDARAAAAIAALLFGLHPAQTEAVTYVSGRSASLMATFYLGGLAAYAAGSARGNRGLLYGLSPVLFALAVATKEVAVTFPLALLWWEACRREGLRDWRTIARRQAAHWMLLVGVGAALLAHPQYATRLVPALDWESLRQNAITQLDAVTYLVLRLVRIYPLNIDPDLRAATEWNLTLAVEAAFLAALAVAALLCRKRRPWWGLALVWFVIHLLPTNSLLPRPDLANDRHLYLACMGVFVAAGIEVARVLSGARVRAWAPVALVLMLLAAATVIRNRDYASEVALWEQTAAVSPGKPRAFNNLGHAYVQAGRADLAEAAYREALRLHPGYDLARANLESLAARGFFDSHVHLNNLDMQLALMDQYGVERAVIFWGRLSDDEAIAAAAEKHPGRFVPFASISPERTALRPQWERDDPAILGRLAALLETGRYRGIGEISVVHAATPGFAATDFSPVSPTMRGILELARKHRVPVMVHCEAHRTAQLSQLLEAFPDVALIWAHGGYTDAVEARRMLERHPNLYYELSARTWPRHPRSAEYPIVRAGELLPAWRTLIEAMPGRFLVGSDASHHVEANERMKLESVRAFLVQLSPVARGAVAGGTLHRLLGEPP